MEASVHFKSSETPIDSLLADKKNKVYLLFQRVQGAMRYVPDFGQTCKAILDAIIDEMDVENCSVMLEDPISGYLTVFAARGKNEEKSIFYPEPSKNGKKFKSGEGIAGWVLKEGQAVMLHDVHQEPRFVKVSGFNDNIHSLICYPIREKDQVVGVFNISHSKKGAFTEADKMAFSYISNQMGAALTSARFFLKIKEIDRLRKDSGEDLSKSKDVLMGSHAPSTLMEVGELTRENGIFIYASDQMRRIKETLDQIANTDVTVLIQGESGVGKEVIARSIHLNSFRQEKPFIKVNCAALPSELLESELFGYERGAFTGAYRQKAGKFELANGGTILLDEISEMNLSLQGKLLQVLQDHEFTRLGGKKDIRVDVRVLVATNKNIEGSVKQGQFREDLYYRLNVVNITVPPLRERKEEIPIFVEYFLEKFSKKYQKKVKPISEKLMKAFLRHPWPGNVRELENMIQRLVVLGDEETILEELTSLKEKELSGEKRKPISIPKHKLSLKEVNRRALERAESEIILKALEMTNWNRKRAAQKLRISYKAFLYKFKKLGLDKRLISQEV